MGKYIDAHCHLDSYKPDEQQQIIEQLEDFEIDRIISVSMHLASCKQNQALHHAYPQLVKPAYGFHPEQPLPTPSELADLIEWIRAHHHEAVAIGEVGLPYYMRLEAEEKGESFELKPYVELLERFIQLAVELKKPIALHAVYEDADIVLDLLEAYQVEAAHFHWFKGAEQTVKRIIQNGYYISFTPDIVYESEIQLLAEMVPLEQIMVETDGPWPFEGPFTGQMTHPLMLASVVGKIAGIKGVGHEQAAAVILENTKRFYG